MAYVCGLLGEEEREDLAYVAGEGVVDLTVEVGHQLVDKRFHLPLHRPFHLPCLLLYLLPHTPLQNLLGWGGDLSRCLSRCLSWRIQLLYLLLLFDLRILDGLRSGLLLLLLNSGLNGLGREGRLRRGGRDFDELFNFDLDVDIDVLGDLFVDGEGPIGEEEVDGDVVVDAEEVAGGQRISEYLKRFVLIASLLIVGRSDHGHKLY
jgi:hypothetical protein